MFCLSQLALLCISRCIIFSFSLCVLCKSLNSNSLFCCLTIVLSAETGAHTVFKLSRNRNSFKTSAFVFIDILEIPHFYTAAGAAAAGKRKRPRGEIKANWQKYSRDRRRRNEEERGAIKFESPAGRSSEECGSNSFIHLHLKAHCASKQPHRITIKTVT